MENLSDLVDILTIKTSDNLDIGDYEYVKLGKISDLSDSSYSLVLEEEREPEFKDYIMSSGIPNPEHMIRVWPRSRKSVLDLLFTRLGVKDVTKYIENEIQCHPEMLPKEPEIESEITSVDIDASLLTEEDFTETKDSVSAEDMALQHAQEVQKREMEIAQKIAQNEDTEGYSSISSVNNDFTPNDFTIAKQSIEHTEKKLVSMEEELHYAINVLEAIAEKNNISMRSANNVLTSNEVLTVIASLKKFDDATFRQIIEQTLLSAKTPGQNRLITDFLSMLYELIDNKED